MHDVVLVNLRDSKSTQVTTEAYKYVLLDTVLQETGLRKYKSTKN